MSCLRRLNCPVFNAERLQSVPEKDEYTVEIGGNTPMKGKYPLKELLSNFKYRTIESRLTSVSGWSIRCDWQGIPWKDFIDWAKPGDYSYVYFESYGSYVTAVERKHMDNPRILLATHVDGDEIEFEYGGPFRSIIPNLWGYKSCKWIKHIHFLDEHIRGYWESAGYPEEGLIEPGFTMDVNTGQRRKINGGEVTEF
ncbi:molybdopterin-dependent oxidoreductase [Limisalsivibrio acetivorans]|uniref:molybdopterin-dependent oxidoreductase n=1 Tax=Limisalsivibrio acetivorans TaxID=1304888 RepID=UPI0003B49869|nr:molybdopterin-dependent oxidoreductase [Limisalsivibrio acetivorans]